MDNNKTLLERLKEYSESNMYPFHMPGHKRNFHKTADFYALDITEIEGFDNLHHPEGILRDSMEWAATIYRADKTYYLVNGSSCGILSAIGATTRSGGTLLISRNCHKSAYHGVTLGQLKCNFIPLQIVDKFGVQGGISPEDVEKLLLEHQNIQAVLIVSPTYEGIISDVRKISEIVHKKGIPLIVDEAHGAHFSFSSEMESALNSGADLVIQSLHKTLPSLTQTAVLHVKKGYVDIERLERYLQIYQSSSPSYLFMASIETCIDYMLKHGKRNLNVMDQRIKAMRKRLSSLQSIRLMDHTLCGEAGVFAVDESKLVISVKDCYAGNRSADGIWLSKLLREKYHLEMEMAGVDYVLAIVTCMDSQEGLRRLEEALVEIDSQIHRDVQKRKTDEILDLGRLPNVCMTISEALDAAWEELSIEDCAGRISIEFIYLYPPGIPILAPGEVVTEDILHIVTNCKRRGFSIQGMADLKADCLRVVKKDF